MAPPTAGKDKEHTTGHGLERLPCNVVLISTHNQHSIDHLAMASTKLLALGFVVLLGVGLASAVRVARYSESDAQGAGTGEGGGGGYVNGAGSGSGSGSGSGQSSASGAH